MLTMLPLLAISMQSVMGLVVFLLIAGVILYFAREFINPTITKVIVGLLVVVSIIWLLQITGLWDGSFD